MRVVDCGTEHAAGILEIYNDAIQTSTALWDYEPRAPAWMQSWLDAKHADGLPVIGALDDAGRLHGFATYGRFRPQDGYRRTAEHSVYVHRDSRGRGFGTLLMRELIARARADGYHTLVAGIDARNTASRRLHERLGFASCGTIREAGWKFGEWLDLEFYQLLLEPAPASDTGARARNAKEKNR